MLPFKVIILLLLNILYVQPNDVDFSSTPLIEVLNPQGFRISITTDSIHINFVRFQISINEELQYSQNIHYKVLYQTVRGRWTWEEPNISLKIGDEIYYSITVQTGRVGYRKSGKFNVTALPSSSNQAPTCRSCNTHHNHATSRPLSPTTSPESTTDFLSPIYQQLFLNCSQNLLTYQFQLEALRKINQQLTAFTEKYPDAKTLTLNGRIPPDDEPVLTTSFIIREKLELNPHIVSAVRKSDNSIEFKVATLTEKLEILDVAKNKLANSRITIS